MATRNQLKEALDHLPTDSASDTSIAVTDEVLLFGDGTIKSMTIENFFTISADISLEMSGDFTDHMIYLHPSSLASGKRAFRIGDYGTETDVEAGEGLVRTYGKISSGTDATAFEFHWGFTETAATLIGSQRQMESHAPTPGPTAIYGMDILTGVETLKYMATGAEGIIGIRSKIFSSNGTNISSNAVALWLDHQINVGGPGGIEASIWGTTGGSKPDTFIWLQTTSSGWSQLLYLDSTMATYEPFVSTGCTIAEGDSPYLKVLVNTTQYGIPLIAI